MPTSYTPNLNLNLPEVGASRDTWGTLLNQNTSTLDSFVHMSMPIGAIIDFGGPQAPAGWLICDGRLVSRVTYAALFAAIGTAWGAGDGSTTFALPPTPGRSSVGPGAVIDETGATVSFTFATVRGAVQRAIAQANLPALNLATDTQGYHAHTAGIYNAGGHTHYTDAQGAHAHGGAYLPDHAHGGNTDGQGNHDHRTTLPGQGAGAAAGPYNVISNVFGNAAYTSDASGFHSHNVQVFGAGNLGLAIPSDGSHGHNISAVGDHAHNIDIYGNGWHQHNLTIPGAGQAFDVMGPVFVCTKIIYAGNQALPLIQGAAVQAQRRLAAPMRGSH